MSGDIFMKIFKNLIYTTRNEINLNRPENSKIKQALGNLFNKGIAKNNIDTNRQENIEIKHKLDDFFNKKEDKH